MFAEQFIDRLEQQGLLDAKVVAELRRRVAKIKDKKVTPEAIAKFLVDKGHLTRFQATKLVNDVTPRADTIKSDKAAEAKDEDDTAICHGRRKGVVHEQAERHTQDDEVRRGGQSETQDNRLRRAHGS